jgi:hypothetical protein
MRRPVTPAAGFLSGYWLRDGESRRRQQQRRRARPSLATHASEIPELVDFELVPAFEDLSER